jgi:hypothetical protein
MAVTRPFPLVQKNSSEGGWRAGFEPAISVERFAAANPAGLRRALSGILGRMILVEHDAEKAKRLAA